MNCVYVSVRATKFFSVSVFAAHEDDDDDDGDRVDNVASM